MTIPYKSEHTKTHDQVLLEYRTAGAPQEWLLHEVADFFADTHDDTQTRLARAQELLSDDALRFEEFVESELLPNELVCFSVHVSRIAGADLVAAFSALPTASSLLLLCCNLCSLGDSVTVRHTLATRADVTITALWPFSMYDATIMTSPNPIGLADEFAVHEPDISHTDHGRVMNTHLGTFVLMLGAGALGLGLSLAWSTLRKS
jgi:hypothetical protein